MSEENNPGTIDVEGHTVVDEPLAAPKNKPAGAPEALVTMSAVKPGDVGQAFVKLATGDRLVDVDIEGEAEVSRIMIGQQTIFRKGSETWADALSRAGDGAFAIVLVQNKSDEATIIEGTAFVARAAGGQASVPTNAAPPAPSIGGPRRDTSLSESVTVGQAHARPASTTVTPKRIIDARQVPMARIRRMVPTVETPPAGSNVVVHDERNVGAHAGSATSSTMRHHSTADLVGTLPRGGEHVVLMAPGHAHGLLAHLTHRAPMLQVFKTTLTRQMLAALDRVGVAGVSASSAEVDVCLPRAVLVHLAGYLRGTMGPMLPNEVAVVKAAIADAFDRQNGRRRAATTTPDSEAIVVAATG